MIESPNSKLPKKEMRKAYSILCVISFNSSGVIFSLKSALTF